MLGFPKWNGSKKTQLTRSAKPERYQVDKRKAVFAKSNTHAAGYDGITSIEEKTFLVLPTSNFPVAAFAISSDWFVNAKVGDTVDFKCSTVLRFLEKLGYVEQDDTPCIFEGTRSEYECVKKQLSVANADTGVAQAGGALCKQTGGRSSRGV